MTLLDNINTKIYYSGSLIYLIQDHQSNANNFDTSY